jgi:uncharacterized protein (DUF1697 family)
VTHVAFLRAINVGGRAVVKMADLQFDAPARLPATLRARITTELVAVFGKEPGVCYRTLAQLDALIGSAPFGTRVSDTSLKLYVAFMDRVPAKVPALPAIVEKELVEIVAIRGADMLIVSRRKPNGMYGFPNACVEDLGVRATTRNWNTVTKLAAFARKG